MPITVSFCAFVVFNNLSLQHNSVSFYQLMKILTTPAVVLLQLIVCKVRESVSFHRRQMADSPSPLAKKKKRDLLGGVLIPY